MHSHRKWAAQSSHRPRPCTASATIPVPAMVVTTQEPTVTPSLFTFRVTPGVRSVCSGRYRITCAHHHYTLRRFNVGRKAVVLRSGGGVRTGPRSCLSPHPPGRARGSPSSPPRARQDALRTCPAFHAVESGSQGTLSLKTSNWIFS